MDSSILYPLIIYGMFTGIIPALAIILFISIIIGIVKGTKKTGHRLRYPEEYKPMNDADKQKEIRSALREDHENHL